MDDRDRQEDLDAPAPPEPTSQGDRLLKEAEEAAAAEAGAIGGRSGMEGMDPAERASAEHGGGQAEGFEESEKLLQEQATHGDPLVDPLRDAGRVEAEPDPSINGEADDVESTETHADTQGTPHEHSADDL